MLAAAAGLILAAAMLAFRRRDLQTTMLVDWEAEPGARASQLPRASVPRSGRLLTSVYGKSLWLRRRSIVAWALGLCGIAALTMLFWPTLSRSIGDFQAIIDMFPSEVFAAFGMGDPKDLLTAGGFISSRVYATVGLVLMLAFAIGMGAASIAGEERRGTLELQLATPLTRRRLLLEAFAAMLTLIAVLGIALCLVMALGNAAIGLDLSLESIVAATSGLALTGVFFGALALALGAATGSTGVARGVPAAVAVGGILLNGLGAVVAGFAAVPLPVADLLVSRRHPAPVARVLGGAAGTAGRGAGGGRDRRRRVRASGSSRASPVRLPAGEVRRTQHIHDLLKALDARRLRGVRTRSGWSCADRIRDNSPGTPRSPKETPADSPVDSS